MAGSWRERNNVLGAARAFMLAVQVGSRTCVRYCQVFITLVIGRVRVPFFVDAVRLALDD